MSLLPSFQRAKQKQTLEDQGFFDLVENATSEKELKSFLTKGQAHFKKLGLGDQIDLSAAQALEATAKSKNSFR